MSTDNPLGPVGLSHDWGKDCSSYYSLIKFNASPGQTAEQTVAQFYDHIVKGYTSLDQSTKAKVKIRNVAITFGVCDAIIVWQAKDADSTKAFRNKVLAGIGTESMTMYCAASDGHG